MTSLRNRSNSIASITSITPPSFLTSLYNKSHLKSLSKILKKYANFIGPGLMVSVAYMDPGNYSTAVAAGSAYQYKLLFSILLSNCLAIFLQILAAKLGAVTGLDLAQNCRVNLSFKTNIFMYILAELAIIATDLAEVVGTAIALNILFKLPLFLGVIVTVIDVLVVLMAYRPKGPLLFIRIFESFVSILVFATVICFGIELYQVSQDPTINFNIGEVFKGFLPNESVIDSSDRKGGNGLFLSLAILGATVMPHSLYLGSGLVQARLKDFDIKNGHYKPLSKKTQSSTQVESNSNLPFQPELDVSVSNISHESDNNNNLTPLATPYNDLSNDPFNEVEQRGTKMGNGSSLSRVNSHFDKDDDSTLKIDDDTIIDKKDGDDYYFFNGDGGLINNDIDDDDQDDKYRPSIHAINDTMSYTIVELVISLFTVALFVNAAILIVAGATLNNGSSGNDDHDKFMFFKRDDDDDDDHNSDYDSDNDNGTFENADLFTIYNLLTKHLSPTAGFVFALALLCSGQSAGVVCTLAGQMVSEGFLSWSLPPVTRRLITRGLAILPCLLVVSFAGREGLAKILNASQVVLAILLPVVSAPLILFTCSKEIMRVPIYVKDGDEMLFDEEQIEQQENDAFGIIKPSSTSTNKSDLPIGKRFKSSESAIRLKDLRNSNPCVGWDEDDEENQNLNHNQIQEQQKLLNEAITSSSSTIAPPPPPPLTVASDVDDDDDVYRVKGYKDFSNGPLTALIAILIWAFITILNLYLLGSMMLGYDVPF